jgi:hypothetical protein
MPIRTSALDDQTFTTALIVEFAGITPALRRDERRFWREYFERRPWILGALLTAAAAELRNLPDGRLEEPPRLTDFALWITACEEALGMERGEGSRGLP